MRVKCDYCRQMIDEGLEKCPYCGATISAVNRVASEQPKTIEELRQWYEQHHLPPENITRFFIGKDVKEPKAFGIYKSDAGDFIVYKNKADGQRAVRYQGVDEGYAVNEIYQRLKAEIADQKEHRAETVKKTPKANLNQKTKRKSTGISWLDHILNSSKYFLAAMGLFIIVCILVAIFDNSPAEGYYRYNGNDYYYQSSKWYVYDALVDNWFTADDDDDIFSTIDSDNYSDYRTYEHTGADFEDSIWYDEGYSDDYDDWDSDSDWDDDYDWDSDYGGWDSDSSDWDSDW